MHGYFLRRSCSVQFWFHNNKMTTQLQRISQKYRTIRRFIHKKNHPWLESIRFFTLCCRTATIALRSKSWYQKYISRPAPIPSPIVPAPEKRPTPRCFGCRPGCPSWSKSYTVFPRAQRHRDRRAVPGDLTRRGHRGWQTS